MSPGRAISREGNTNSLDAAGSPAADADLIRTVRDGLQASADAVLRRPVERRGG